jgi:hypothetical protein
MQEAELVSRGREAFARRAWRDAFESLSRADQTATLGADELELLATSAYMLSSVHITLTSAPATSRRQCAARIGSGTT